MVYVLLPGLDGTGLLFRWFLELLPEGTAAISVRYPECACLEYEELAALAGDQLPRNEPYVLIAESFSGPIAMLLASRATEHLRAVVFVSSFLARPFGRFGSWISPFITPSLPRVRPPAWCLDWLMLSGNARSEVRPLLQEAISRVQPDVLADRIRQALEVDCTRLAEAIACRVLCFLPDRDRLIGSRGLEGLQAAWPSLEIVRIPGPHLLLQCSPEDCMAALKERDLVI